MPKVPASHMQERRRQIAEAALQCFRTKGIAETRMRDIFAAAGLSAGAVYNHFPAKADLIVHLARESAHKWDAMLAHAADDPGRSPATVLKDLMGNLIDGLERPDIVAEIAGDIGVWAYAITRDDLRPACHDVFTTVARGFDRILAGRPDADTPPPLVGHHLLAQLQGLGLQVAMGLAPDLARQKAIACAVIDRFAEEGASC